MSDRADLVLRGGTVLTMDASGARAQAVAVKDGRITGVGADHDVESLIGPGTRVLDCRGRAITPGFIDSHTHNVHVGEFRFKLDQLNLAAELAPSVEDVLARVRERAQRSKPGEWIGGRNVEPNGMRERRWPTRRELDGAAPANPVMLTIRGGHACVANTRALEAAGIGPDTPNPEGGVIDRDERGDLTGVLRDVTSIRTALPVATLPDLKDFAWAAPNYGAEPTEPTLEPAIENNSTPEPSSPNETAAPALATLAPFLASLTSAASVRNANGPSNAEFEVMPEFPSDFVRESEEPAEQIEPAAASQLDPAVIEAIAQRVIERMQPNLIELVTRELLRPAVEALVQRELEKK